MNGGGGGNRTRVPVNRIKHLQTKHVPQRCLTHFRLLLERQPRASASLHADTTRFSVMLTPAPCRDHYRLPTAWDTGERPARTTATADHARGPLQKNEAPRDHVRGLLQLDAMFNWENSGWKLRDSNLPDLGETLDRFNIIAAGFPSPFGARNPLLDHRQWVQTRLTACTALVSARLTI